MSYTIDKKSTMSNEKNTGKMKRVTLTNNKKTLAIHLDTCFKTIPDFNVFDHPWLSVIFTQF